MKDKVSIAIDAETLRAISLKTLTKMWKMWEMANKKPEPPELEHGDCGFDSGGDPCAAVEADRGGGLRDVSHEKVFNEKVINGGCSFFHVKTKIFNAFADLAAIKVAMEAGDVTDFKFRTNFRNCIRVCTVQDIIISTSESSLGKAALTLPELKQFIIKLRALAAKLEQENADC